MKASEDEDLEERQADRNQEHVDEKAWRAFTKHFWRCPICRNLNSELGGREHFCPDGQRSFLSTALTEDNRERLEVWAALVRAVPYKQSWKKAAAAARSAGEFVAGIVAIVAAVYGFSWVTDDILAHAHIHVDHHWWAYRVWHAWWWVIVPLAMVAGGRLWHRRIMGKGLWFVGVLWLGSLGFSAGMALWVGLIMYLVDRCGWSWGIVLTCAVTASFALGCAAAGWLFDLARKRCRSLTT